jgi:hypothetical protein
VALDRSRIIAASANLPFRLPVARDARWLQCAEARCVSPIGCGSSRHKQVRAVAAGDDKLACLYQAAVTIADRFIWLRADPTSPRCDPRNTP